MKEIKDAYIRFRTTANEKAKILEYCDRKGITITEFYNRASKKLFQEEESNEII